MLGKRLAALRKKKKVRQEDVARYLKIARTTYGMYEQNKREPDLETVHQLADYYEVTTDYLLGRAETPTFTAQEQSFLQDLHLPDEELFQKYLIQLSIDEKKITDQEAHSIIAFLRTLRMMNGGGKNN